MAREEALDRTTAVRRLLETSIRRWEIERALRGYQEGVLSLGRAAEDAGLTQWELLDSVQQAGIAYPLDADTVRERIGELTGGAERAETLPDIPPKPGGVLLVGINPAPISVAAGHYYQGRLGRRLWRRLEELGLLRDAVSGAEDDAFTAAGNGLTDLVKRPTRSSTELTATELDAGVEELLAKIAAWKPGLVLFAFKETARRLVGRSVAAGPGPDLEGVPTFLLSGPYAARAEREQNDSELRQLLASIGRGEAGMDHTQTIRPSDLATGRIRLPRSATGLLPSSGGDVEIVVRGTRLRARYDPRASGRSAVLGIGKARLESLVELGEQLSIRRGIGGVVILD